MQWSVPKIWTGGDCWIFGGGNSILKQFDVPQDAQSLVLTQFAPPAILTPYFEVLRDKHVIAINAAYQVVPFADMIFFGDNKFYEAFKKDLLRFPKPVISCHTSFPSHKRIRYLARDNRKPRGISTREGCVSWNANSGSAAISIAVQAGAKRIFLLGFDMHRTEEGHKHFHKAYKGKIEERESRGVPAKDNFPRHMKGFPIIAQDAKRLGVEIYNVNPESAVKEFPLITLQEALTI